LPEKCDCPHGFQRGHDPSQSEKLNKARYCSGLGYSGRGPITTLSRLFARAESRIRPSGLVTGKGDVVIENRSPYIKQRRFADYGNRLFLPPERKVRTNRLLVSRLAVLLMDNCNAHISDEVQKAIADYGVMMTMYAPHATNIFQILDISLFGIFNLIKGNADESGMLHEITENVVKIIRVIQRSCNPPNVQSAFRKAGLECISVSEPSFITFHEERLRETEGFRKIWDIDFPMEASAGGDGNRYMVWLTTDSSQSQCPLNTQPSLEIFSLS
jgi:hypothetical protein